MTAGNALDARQKVAELKALFRRLGITTEDLEQEELEAAIELNELVDQETLAVVLQYRPAYWVEFRRKFE